ncbi:general substrate transporter [Penicillium angulare]|uniref:general substrate transporter n=1 Tax=Penicillium angulare TaxID=116970 RepID=UPI00253FCF63|nr:general substrate transporter [Penicillium angulare]KAJ5263938.1 general substrate transporter [Penicillium angulare]
MGINSERHVGAFNFATVLALCLGSLTYGYSFSVTSTTLGQSSFFSYFNLSDNESSPSYAFTNRIIGGLNGCFSGGGFLGAIFGGWACDALGRKKTLLVCTPIGVLGGALQGGSVNIAMLLAGRLIGGFAVGVLMVLVPLFQSEIAPPATRGFLVSQHVLMQNRPREAWEVLQKLHDTKSSSDRSSFAKIEFYQITKQVAEDQEMSNSETVWTLFTKTSYRKRMICAFLVMFGSESTGILVVYNYSVLLYEGLGFTGSIPLLLAAAYVTVAFCGNYISSLLIDRIGRRTSLVIGISGCGISLIFEAALSATYVGTTNHAGLSAGVFFLFLYISFEIFPTHIRSRGMSWSLAILFLSTVAYLIPAPTAFAQVGWKYYLLFILLTAIQAPLLWIMLPETKGLALEEIGDKFGDHVAVHITQLATNQKDELEKMFLESTGPETRNV